MSFALDSSGLISLITDIAKNIQQAAERVKANKQQSARLSECINMKVGFLKSKHFQVSSNLRITYALATFCQFLQRCELFIHEFKTFNWLTHIWHHGNHATQFKELYQELNQYAVDLNLGFTINQYNHILHVDHIDAQNDAEEIEQILTIVRKT